MFIYALILVLTALVYFRYFYGNVPPNTAINVADTEEIQKQQQQQQQQNATPPTITSYITTASQKKISFVKQKSSYLSADVMTTIAPRNICVAIFKNPSDHKYHFYRTRLKGMNLNNIDEDLLGE
jgi:hypothetical protein